MQDCGIPLLEQQVLYGGGGCEEFERRCNQSSTCADGLAQPDVSIGRKLDEARVYQSGEFVLQCGLGHIGRLEVLAAQRVVYGVPAQGAPLLLKLAPSAYHADTAQIMLRWSAADDSAH